MKRILVTGGAGFIGSHVVDLLSKSDAKVYVMDDFSTGKVENIAHHSNDKVNVICCDIASDAARKAIKDIKPDGIIMLAAQPSVIVSIRDPLLDASSNIMGLVHLLESAREVGCKKVVFASSGGTIYGNVSDESLPVTEEHPLTACSFYGLTKLTALHYLNLYKQLFSIDFAALALGNVYGPRQSPFGEAGVIGIFSQKILSNETCTINGDGNITRDYIYVADVAQAFVSALHQGSGLINISSGVEKSVKEIYDAILDISQCQGSVVNGPELAGEVKRIALQNTKAKSELNWEPKVNFNDGVKSTVDWVRQEYLN
ncbi:putative nucleoside-diphosphate-sugar epimerase [Photobacterium gaetbulicola Gung47]|uniref:Putative nucleoside-diphosphate-sugar epimerase n=1 Tax=Photobacterium gaetbulicola Gung47 TaxID=658445 RepID=A0A0C5WK48_9GAMM|nr:GDP-mannose 4,6-dehydratase [Photobacterium gaetbulicola]AJR05489.1 putative nucleoside-diphosphate-sugar epimerase [Photobacterium gaetbulicola Gung47]